MEPIQEASVAAEQPRAHASPAPPAGPGGRPAPFTTSSPARATSKDIPSLKYREIEQAVNLVTLKHAQAPPSPTLPRRAGIRTWAATAKERNPLISSLTGPGRAGKFAELRGDAGGRYEGEVLAGRPHGNGKYYASKGPGLGDVLQYDGDWVQGRREGFGTRYFQNGETYVGQFVANIRHGKGRFNFANGDYYIGDWVDDRRTGRGTYCYGDGSVFVGNFVRDRKEGMGTLYLLSRQKKLIAEYVNGEPKCGTVLQIDDEDLEPLRGQLMDLALTKKLDMAATGKQVPAIPELQLQQASKVLGPEIVAVRRTRAQQGDAKLRAVQEHGGMLSDRELEMLRHSFTLMAGGDDPAAGLLPHQLRELAVMAGLDPASSLTHHLVEALLSHKSPATGRISYDAFMRVALHFRDKAVDDEFELDVREEIHLLQEESTSAAHSTADDESASLSPQPLQHVANVSAVAGSPSPPSQDAALPAHEELSMVEVATPRALNTVASIDQKAVATAAPPAEDHTEESQAESAPSMAQLGLADTGTAGAVPSEELGDAALASDQAPQADKAPKAQEEEEPSLLEEAPLSGDAPAAPEPQAVSQQPEDASPPSTTDPTGQMLVDEGPEAVEAA